METFRLFECHWFTCHWFTCYRQDLRSTKAREKPESLLLSSWGAVFFDRVLGFDRQSRSPDSRYTGPSMALEIHQHEIAPGIAVVAPVGKMMVGSGTEQIVGVVEDLLRQGTRTIIFDLTGVTTLDSTGVGQFISSFNKIAAAGGDMRMAGATGHVFRTFHVSMLDKMFRFYATAEDAARG